MTPPTTSTEVRQNLLDALQIDLVGPDPASPYFGRYKEELLSQAPSKWYLTGFLAPYGAALEVSLALEDDLGGEIENNFEKKEGIEDGANPEIAAARTVPFPSSIGLSFLLPNTVTTLTATITWGDYYPIEVTQDNPEEEEKSSKKTYQWGRVHQAVEMPIPLNAQETTTTLPVVGHEGVELTVINRPVENDAFPDGTRALSIFLVNHRKGVKDHKDATYLFQAQLTLHCPEGFIPRSNPNQGTETDPDEQIAALQYRNDYEFAVGHNVAAVATPDSSDPRRCQTIRTAWIPTYEVPRVDASKIPGIDLGMETLAGMADSATLQAALRPLIHAYEVWIEQQKTQSSSLAAHHQKTAQQLLKEAELAKHRMNQGIDLLSDPHAFKAFTMANQVIAKARRQQLSQEKGSPPESFDPPQWRPFQIAFILLNLSGIAQPEAEDRGIVDLLFFPTGGGKTEAYLGLAAFTLVYRRLVHPGIQGAGVSIIMRYTLRLLTLDQLERAARLICALELERQQDPTLGEWPFEIGLWVGSGATPNRMGGQGQKNNEGTAYELWQKFRDNSVSNRSPIPLERCPWCGTKFDPRNFSLSPDLKNPKSLRVQCDDYDCQFSDQQLPIIAVDEPLYRRLPCFLIATVDKFAGLPWFGQTGKLFGKVSHYQPNEGFFSAADESPLGQKLTDGLPPPDLIIQDELHLISGPLGTMVGLYETAVDALCSTYGPKPIRPKIIASTATVRRAQTQIQALFNRNQVQVFPPPGPDRHNSFFAETVPATPQEPGRLYVGIAAQGRSLKVVLLRAYLALLSSGQHQWEQAGGRKNAKNPADPYMTLMGYFNALRELGGSRRIVEDEVVSRLRNYQDRKRVNEEVSFFSKRKIADSPEELTSRVDTNKIAETKRKLSLSFTDKDKVDVALATNMISVGLDIVRLGLMVILGQPKTAAEYIQSSSRVGRDKERPGLVVTLMNIHRPRDRSHYERFQYWHQTFYRAVEATSVTPFSSRALDRGLAAVTVAIARLGLSSMTPPQGASAITQQRQMIDALVKQISDRAGSHSKGDTSLDELAQHVSNRVTDLLDTWDSIQNENQGSLQYNKSETEGVGPLLLDPMELAVADPKPSLERQKFKAPRSLRDVELSVPLYISDPFSQDRQD
ncbi:DISARM system helicase DrmA [Phormidium sp. FACHB-1136]|uniref:DISARM system helicase DrmA n=1 Tax=Phormidium sp. FACHB-1136 TaxID=2692848 RepID=UPI001683243C|nr:DISARM system helicase DrmA [Phormidium sp. FACHB-1136]MBD2428240.1 helicase [Phormidium sp. FACHB-1136]